MGPQGEIRLTVVLDGKTGSIRVEGPLDALNRFACISLMMCGIHELQKFYDERESKIEKPDEASLRKFGVIKN